MSKEDNNIKLDTYFKLCTEVYELSKPAPPEDAYAFYRDYAARAKGPILEPMCGTGRFLIPLLEEGLNIHGFDASEHMLEVLRTKARAKNLEVTVWKGFIQDFKKSQKYNLIYIPSGSFCLITDLEQVKRSLKRIYDHLSDNGIFLFEAEISQPVSEEGIWSSSVWTKENGQKIILSRLTTTQKDIRAYICKYELMELGRIIDTEIEKLKVRLYKPDYLVEALKVSGFRSVRILKAFDGIHLSSKKDELLIYECRK